MILRASLYANALLLIACLFVGALWRHEVARKNAVIADYAKAMVAAQIDAANAAKAADDRLRKAQAAIPHTGESVAKAVHDHPTDPACIVPDAAADSLQDGIRAGASATAR